MVVWIAEIETIAEFEARTCTRWRMATKRDWRKLTKEQPVRAQQLKEELKRLRNNKHHPNDVFELWVQIC